MENESGVFEISALDLLREKYRTSTVHPRTDVFSEDELELLPVLERDAIRAARDLRQRRRAKRRKAG